MALASLNKSLETPTTSINEFYGSPQLPGIIFRSTFNDYFLRTIYVFRGQIIPFLERLPSRTNFILSGQLDFLRTSYFLRTNQFSSFFEAQVSF